MEEQKSPVLEKLNDYISTVNIAESLDGDLLRARLENAYLQGYIDSQQFHLQKILRNEKN